MTALLLSVARMTLPLAGTLAVLPLLSRRSAALRAWVVLSGLAGAAIVPALELVAPSWGSPLVASTALPAGGPAGRLLVLVWISGFIVHLALLGVGIVRLMRIAGAADPIREGLWTDLALEIGADYRVHAPVVLLEAVEARLPVTWGHSQPKVLLPAEARNWSEERVRIVLRHELAHVRRRDWLVQLFASVVRSVYWFHPLVWAACSRLRFECERACDDAVLAGGVSGPRYAAHLLDLARGLVRLRAPVTALAGRSTLERRVRAMLATGTDRSPLRRGRGVAVAAVMLVVATATAGFGAAATTAAAPAPVPPKRLTLLLDGRIMDLSREWPTYPDPRAGLVVGPGLAPELQRP